MKYVGDKVSYVRNPFARNSYYCLVLAVLSLALAGTSMYLSVSQAGQGGLNTGALGFASIMAALMGLWYGLLSFREKERTGKDWYQYWPGAADHMGSYHHYRAYEIDRS